MNRLEVYEHQILAFGKSWMKNQFERVCAELTAHTVHYLTRTPCCGCQPKSVNHRFPQFSQTPPTCSVSRSGNLMDGEKLPGDLNYKPGGLNCKLSATWWRQLESLTDNFFTLKTKTGWRCPNREIF